MSAKKGIDWDSQPLGKVSDTEIARSLGVAKTSVLVARRARGIPALRAGKGPKGIDWDNVDLGMRPDKVIAKQLGVTKGAVHGARVRRGIPSFDGSRKSLLKATERWGY